MRQREVEAGDRAAMGGPHLVHVVDEEIFGEMVGRGGAGEMLAGTHEVLLRERLHAEVLMDLRARRPCPAPVLPALERGEDVVEIARFVDDIALPGVLHAAFVRSPVAHGKIRHIDTAAARAAEGVQAVLTFADLRPLMTGDRIPLALPSAAIRFDVDPAWLADREVCHVGEPVVLVVAASRRIAEDAARLVALDIEPLPAVVDPFAAAAPGAPRVRLDCPDNLVARTAIDYGDVDKAFAGAAHRVAECFHLHKGGGHSIEPRGVMAKFDAAEETLTVWDGTQMPHRAKAVLVAALGFAEHQVRVIAPDVGGGFGPKAVFHPEELARNHIAAEKMPYPTPVVQRDGATMVYDSGDYPECQRRALAAAGWADFPARREAARRGGRLIGIGLSNYVEATGRAPFESAGIRIGPSGAIVVTTGATSQGQGVKTMLAQIAADVLHVAPSSIHVVDGDTAASPLGLGAFASRQAVTAGNAAHRAALIIADKIRQAGASLMETSPDDLELVDGAVRVKGVPGMQRSFAQVAKALAGVPGFALPGGLPPGLAAAVDFEPPALTYTNGCHVVEAEVDPETGLVRLLRYVVVHDCGRVINPMMLDGQVLGGVVNGIGATLTEWMRYTQDGQPLTVTYADYLLPSADTVPPIEIHHMESPTPLNPLGVKGAAESGTIGAPAAIVSAIEDALRPLGVVIRDLPVTPARLSALIAAAARK
jgi:CO/xanthine dehydrogenase Mo-binding subunit